MTPSPHLIGRDRYERAIEGWSDNTHEDAFTHTVRLTDDDASVEVSLVCTPAPGYEVREARARILAGGAESGATTPELGRLAGARMVAGFTRRLAVVCADGARAALFVDAGVEVARLARQVTKLPAAATDGLSADDAQRCWTLDATGWNDLPDSCFTYSPAGRALLATRPVSTPMVRDLYSPPPGRSRIFVRRKLSRLVRTGDRLHLFHSMHDNVHGFDIHYEIDLGSGRILAADSVTSRLPYSSICAEPQAKIQSLIGEVADAGLRKRMQPLIGGSTGCAQLHDLTADLLKLLALS